MYQVGQLVVYGIHGVCRISQIQDRVVDRVSRRYLVLEPVNRSGSQYFVPMHNPAAMQKLSPLLSPEELTALLSSERVRTDCWIVDENRRKQFYRELSGSGSREKLAQTVYNLYLHRKRQKSCGKRLHICDENFLHDAEKILAGEIQAVLGYTNAEALEYLACRLQEKPRE